MYGKWVTRVRGRDETYYLLKWEGDNTLQYVHTDHMGCSRLVRVFERALRANKCEKRSVRGGSVASLPSAASFQHESSPPAAQ